MQPVRLCTFLALIAVLQAYGTLKKVLDFLSIVRGDYDNKEKTEEDGDDHAFIQVRIIPVDIPCLRPYPVIFAEHAINGVITVFSLAVIKNSFGDTVSETIYNFTDHTKYKPGQFNVEKLSNFSCGDLQGAKDCIARYRVSSKGFVSGIFPQCSITVNKKHPRFAAKITCDSIRVTEPMDSDQVSPVEPFELKLTRKNYPLINPPQDYKGPCGN